MSEWLAEFWLPLATALPAGVAAVLAILGLLTAFFGAPAIPTLFWRAAGLSTLLMNLVLVSFGAGVVFDPERVGFQSVQSFGWSRALGAELMLGIDGIGLCFLVSTALLGPLAMLAAWRQMDESIRSWVFVCLLLESSLIGALASIHFLSFVFFWALALLPVLLWLGRWGGAGRARAASRVWATESIGLACLLFVAFVLREVGTESLGAPVLGLLPSDGPNGGSLLDLRFSASDERLLLGVMMVAVATRLPLAPLHFWLPAAHATAPSGLSMLIATGFVQTAAVGLLHFGLPLFPNAAVEAGPLISLLGIVALVYASFVALVQKDLKRLVAYASVGYAGFALFGISTLNTQGMTGAVLQLLTHGLATAGLFGSIGFLAVRRQTTDVAAFGGLVKPMPVAAFFFGFMALSLMGLPALGGFVGDLFVLLGSLETRRRFSWAALIAMVVAASYLLWLQRRIFLGPVDEPANRGLIDLDWLERGMMLSIALPLLWIGLYPNPVLRRVEPAVLEILFQMEQRSVVPAPGKGVPGEEADATEFAEVRDEALIADEREPLR